MEADPPIATAYDQRTKFRVLVVTVVAAGLVFLDTSIATVALHAIQADLGISTSVQQWVASGYLLTLSALLLVGGRLADLFGRRGMFRTGLVAYAALSCLAALSPNGYVLIAARAMQGVAGAVLVPTTLALINSVYPPSERGKAIGTWAAWSGIFTLLGPVIGGAAIDHLSWRLAFLITPVLAVSALALSRPVPESRDESADRHLDFGGVILAALCVGGLVFALVQGPVSGWTSPLVLGAAAVGVLLVPAFLAWERRAASPVMPFAMFSDRNLAVANIVTFFVYAGLYGTFFYTQLYTQSSLGLTATLAGALFIPNTVLLFFLSPYAGRLNDRYGPRWLMCFGPLISAVGLVIMSLTGPGQVLTVLEPGVVVFGIGLGFTVTPVTATAIGAAEQRFSGIASGFNNAVSRVAGLVAIALMGAIVVQLWHAGIAASTGSAPVPVVTALESVRDKAFVLPTPAGLSVADAADAHDRALAAAQSSFRDGLWLAAALVATGGIVSAVGIRAKQPAGEKA
jgi:EmrB/QacA subfamily drug resistance transporter